MLQQKACLSDTGRFMFSFSRPRFLIAKIKHSELSMMKIGSFFVFLLIK